MVARCVESSFPYYSPCSLSDQSRSVISDFPPVIIGAGHNGWQCDPHQPAVDTEVDLRSCSTTST